MAADHPTGPNPEPVFVYDGDCAFCSSCARFVTKRIPTRAEVVAWQHVDLDALGLTQEEAEAAVQWVPPPAGPGVAGGPVVAGPEAIARLLVDAGSYWKVFGWVLDLWPVRLVAWPVYRLVSRNRHRMPGGTAACSLPQAQRDKLAGKAEP